MKLFSNEIRKKLLANGRKSQMDDRDFDPFPVVKLFTPDGSATWLLSELDPENPDIAFGLCDLGMGFPELGSVSVKELEQVRGSLGLPIERDVYFSADTMRLSEHADRANGAGQIISHAHTNVFLDIAT